MLLRNLLLAACFALASATSALAQAIVLDTFNSGSATGSVRPGTSWVGQTTQNAGTVTVGGGARDDNGWGATGLSLNATGMNFLAITAQRDAGHTAPSFVIQFEDRNLNTQVFAVNASTFASGTLSTVQITLGNWNAGFDRTQITGWSIGGGSVGTAPFRMTFDLLQLSATASPGVPVAPAITGDFTPRTVAAGAAVSFTVAATGTAPLAYQWFKNASTPVAGATADTLAFASVVPTDAGSYTCAVTNAAGTTVSSAFVLSVTATPAVVTLGNLAATYSGSPKAATATTVPAGLPVTFTYNGSAVAPTSAGNYTVVATVNHPTYGGSATGTLVIARAVQTVAFAPLPTTIRVGTAFTLSATATSGGPVTLAVVGGGATLNGTSLTPTAAAAITVRGAQAGDTNYLPASTDLTFTTAKQNQSITFAAVADQPPGTAPVTLSATASSGLPVSFAVLGGPAVVVGNTVTPTGTGTVLVRASQGGNDTFNAAPDVDRSFAVAAPAGPPAAPEISLQPAGRTASVGSTVQFTVIAAGSGTLSYQWSKDGAALAGATTDTLTLAAVTDAQAGAYTVAVSNLAGSVTSRAAVLRVVGRGFVGSYFGTFGGGGACALHVREDQTGAFVGYAGAPAVAYVATSFAVDAGGAFRFSAGGLAFEGIVAAAGTVTGTGRGSVTLALSATKSADDGAARLVAGVYDAAVAGASGRAHAIVAAAGQIFTVLDLAGAVDGGTGTVDAVGAVRLTTAGRATVTGTVNVSSGVLALEIAGAAGAAPVALTGLRDNAAGVAAQRLVNVSTRTRAGTGDAVAIAGFVIGGEASKQVLIRAVGPALGAFGVGDALAAPRLELYRGQTLVAANTGWSTGASVDAVAAAAARVGAFALTANSADSALLSTLAPGAYTAVVSAADGRAGIGLIEAYDLSAAVAGQRLSNLSVRSFSGGGVDTLIVGVVVQGTVPKRMLVRAVGPTLAAFGVGGALAQPRLALFSGEREIAANTGWSSGPDAAAIAAAAAAAGAFALPAGSADAALVINLAPGAYTAQVSGVGGTSGVALVEAYELP